MYEIEENWTGGGDVQNPLLLTSFHFGRRDVTYEAVGVAGDLGDPVIVGDVIHAGLDVGAGLGGFVHLYVRALVTLRHYNKTGRHDVTKKQIT